MLHVLLATDVYHPFICGVTRVVDTLVKELPRYGVRVSLMAPASLDVAYVMRRDSQRNKLLVRSVKLSVLYSGMEVPEIICGGIASRRLIHEVLGNNDELLIHAHSPYVVTSLIRITCWSTGMRPPIVLTYHTLTNGYIDKKFGVFAGIVSWFDRVIINNTIRRANAIIFPSMYAVRVLLGYVGTRSFVHKFVKIPNPLDRKFYDAPPKGAEYYFDELETGGYAIWVGRISYEKNIQMLIGLFKRLKHRLVIVGRGPLLRHLKRVSPPNVTFTGFISDEVLISLLRSARCFIITSSFDNLPLAVMEAMAQGVPVVSYFMGGHNEYISHGDNGFKFHTIIEAKRYIEKIFSSDELREEMGEKARETALIFHPDNIIPKYVRLYERSVRG